MTAPPTPYEQSTLLGRYRLIIAVVAPILALVTFSAWVVEEKMDAYRDSADLLVAAQIARAAQSLTRELESERVLSARSVNRDDLQTRYELEAQRLNTDERLKTLSAALLMPEIAARVPDRSNILNPAQLGTLRAAVDLDATASAASAGYSRAITGLTALATTMAPADLSRIISAYMDLGNLKDRIGRARVLLSTPNQNGEFNRQSLAENNAEARAFLESFRTHASAPQIKSFDDIVQGPIVGMVERLHNQALSGMLGDKDRQAWDDAHVALLKLYTRAEDHMSSDMEKAIQENLKSTRFTFFLVVLGVIILVGLSLESLRRSERRAVLWEEEARKLFRAVEQSPVSVLISDAQGLIEYVNPAFTTMTGYHRDEVLGHSPRMLRSDQTPAEVFAELWAAIKAGQDWRGEIVNQRKDGSVYWESMTVAPVKDGDGHVDSYIAFKEDVTEIRTLRLTLELEHANLRRVFASTKDLIALIDAEGHFEYANPALEQTFGPVIGLRARDYFQPAIGNLEDDNAPTRGEWVADLNGKTYEITITPVDNAQGAPSALLALHDITTRKLAEMAMAEAREAAELSNRAKTEFLATMSHELRTPLNAIIGFSEIIENELLGPLETRLYRDYAHDINESGRHLLTLINDILDVARLEVGRFALMEMDMDVAQTVRISVQLVSERAKAAGLRIVEHIPDDLPGLHGDERRIKQTIANILANAVKFTAAGGKVTISVQTADNGLDIIVSDSGIGIHADDMTKIMAPFGQAESSLSRRFDGAGLGLPLARRFMDMHGGHLAISSTPGQGTVVTLHFPASRLLPAQPAE
ncbi:PAS domain S-box protein [Magnetospirillum sulfuroxidans]|uniref:histidine kinase n=1 Tax=Magnetospirillum sulfuroxidans TaxID=611300 RepID=A0ABS5IDC4_9PROT|nr:PAS domain S-box protein [Magnetospirillum sulfuroxidans]MBR9971688.1 PAS domain S-box protein [Magnetospirillum sulfuroxidans]